MIQPDFFFREPAEPAQGPHIDLLTTVLKIIVDNRGLPFCHFCGNLHKETGLSGFWGASHDTYTANSIKGMIHLFKTGTESEKFFPFFPFKQLEKATVLFFR